MLNVGNLKNIACARGESKHQELKQMAHINNSHVNLPKTLATFHQLRLCAKLLDNQKNGFRLSIEIGKPDNRKMDNKLYYSEYREILNSCTSVKSVTIKSIEYKLNMLLNYEDSDIPSFGVIENILVKNLVNNLELKFIINCIKTKNYDDHVQAYEIDVNSYNYKLIDYESLNNKFPSDILYSADCNAYTVFNQ